MPANALRERSSGQRFADRRDAGRRLARRLVALRGERPVVVALPRGGVPVGYEIARALGAPLDVLAVRKLGAPQNPEFGIGAVAEGGTKIIDARSVNQLGVTAGALERIVARETEELARRVEVYRRRRPALDMESRAVIVVDDGVATGVTDLAALRALRSRHPRRLILAVPICAPGSRRRLEQEADEVVCELAPAGFRGVGQSYDDFSQVSDEEVLSLLAAAARDPESTVQEVRIPAGPVELPGDLRLPGGTARIVLFAHGSGSSRRSPRNMEVAQALGERGLGTLLFDLLTGEESRDRAKVFDIRLLADRLVAATLWLRARPDLARLSVGYFGASTGAAAALAAAADLPGEVAAVVSRGGRPDLAGESLEHVHASTLLIVGGEDHQVLELNRAAQERLRTAGELAVVPGAGHLFEEPGALDVVARLAGDWFTEHLPNGEGRAS